MSTIKRLYFFDRKTPFDSEPRIEGPYETRALAREMRRLLSGPETTCGPVTLYRRSKVVR